MSYVKSPVTGRMIKVGGETYNSLLPRYRKKLESAPRTRRRSKSSPESKSRARKLMKSKVSHKKSVGRGGATRGWKDVKAGLRKKSAKAAMEKKCGSHCFLASGHKFPVCDPKSCRLDCRGVVAARVRAAQYKYRDVEAAAKSLERRKCGRRV